MRTWVELCLFPQMSGALTAATSDCDLVRQEGLHQVSKGKPTLQLAPINTNGFFIKGNWDTAHSHTAHIHTHTHMYTCVCTHLYTRTWKQKVRCSLSKPREIISQLPKPRAGCIRLCSPVAEGINPWVPLSQTFGLLMLHPNWLAFIALKGAV